MALVPWLPTCSRGGIILPFNGLWDYQDHNFFLYVQKISHILLLMYTKDGSYCV